MTLAQAVAELSRGSSVSIGSDGPLPQLRTQPIHGRMTIDEALARLLAHSGFRARRVGATAWRIERASAEASALRLRPAVPHLAGTNPPPTIVDTTPITVTAAKRVQLINQLPMNIAVVKLEKHDQHDPLRGSDWIAGEIEGLSQAAAGPGRSRLFLRGIADSPFSNESQSTVAILMDDARLTYSAPDPGIRLVDVARVEVLKGPQGSLHGSGALGGVYQIVTNRAVIDSLSAAASVGGQAVLGGGDGVTATAVLNLPVLPGLAALRLVGYTAREPGWIDTGRIRNSNAGSVHGGRAELGVDAGSGWRIDLTGFAQYLDVDDSQYVYQPGARSRMPQLPEPHDNDLRHTSVRIAGELGATQIVLSSGMTWHHLSDTLDATIGGPGLDPTSINPQTLNSDRHYKVWDSEVRANGKMGKIDWLVGVSLVKAVQHAVQLVVSEAPSTPYVLDDDRRDTTDAAIYGDITIPLLKAVKIDVGGRLYHGTIQEARQLPTGPIGYEQSHTGVTPSVSLSWQPQPSRLFYIRYGSAQRQGGLDIRQGGQLERLRSDALWTTEAGWRERTALGGQIDLNAYYTWWDHIQSDTLLPDGEIAETNAGSSRIIGLEASYMHPIGTSWRLSLGGTLQNAVLVQNETGMPLPNNRLPIIPDYTVRGSLQHDFHLGEVLASLRAQLRYIGPARLSFDPALDRPVGHILESRIEGHLSWDGYELSARIENLFNRSSDTFAFGNPLRFFASRQYTPQRPLTGVISVLKQF